MRILLPTIICLVPNAVMSSAVAVWGLRTGRPLWKSLLIAQALGVAWWLACLLMGVFS